MESGQVGEFSVREILSYVPQQCSSQHRAAGYGLMVYCRPLACCKRTRLRGARVGVGGWPNRRFCVYRFHLLYVRTYLLLLT